MFGNLPPQTGGDERAVGPCDWRALRAGGQHVAGVGGGAGPSSGISPK